MILADTSIWVDHYRRREPQLLRLLEDDELLIHPFIIGELAMGWMKEREATLRGLNRLVSVNIARDAEVLVMVESRNLYGRGMSYVDAHLLVSVQLTPGALLWTRDRRLREAAEEMSLGWPGAA